jgi:hypothetical protein
MTKRFTVTFEDGTTATRTSETKDYTHAFVVRGLVHDAWMAMSFHTSHELARRAMYSAHAPKAQKDVLPVTVEDITPKTRLDERTRRLRSLKTSITKAQKDVERYAKLAEERPGQAEMYLSWKGSREITVAQLKDRLAAEEAK